MTASLLTPIEPLDGSYVAKGPVGVAASLALLAAAVFLLLGLTSTGPGEKTFVTSRACPRLASRGSGRRGSNPRPQAWETHALPTELRPRCADSSPDILDRDNAKGGVRWPCRSCRTSSPSHGRWSRPARASSPPTRAADDQEAVHVDRRRVDRGDPPRLPRAAVHHAGRRRVHQRRDPVRRDDPPDGRPTAAVRRVLEPGIVPGIKVDAGAQAARAARARDHRGPRRAARAPGEYRELGARFAKWRAVITIGDGHPERVLHRGERPRARALRGALPGGRASCRSSSPRC